MGTALAFALQAFTTLPDLIAAGIDIAEFVKDTSANLTKMKDEERDPTDEEWEALNKVVEDLRAQRDKTDA